MNESVHHMCTYSREIMITKLLGVKFQAVLYRNVYLKPNIIRLTWDSEPEKSK